MKVVRLPFKLINNIVAVNLLHLDGRIIALQMIAPLCIHAQLTVIVCTSLAIDPDLRCCVVPVHQWLPAVTACCVSFERSNAPITGAEAWSPRTPSLHQLLFLAHFISLHTLKVSSLGGGESFHRTWDSSSNGYRWWRSFCGGYVVLRKSTHTGDARRYQ